MYRDDMPRERRVTSPYGTPSAPRTPRRARSHVRGWLLPAVVVVLFGVVFFAGSYATSPEPGIAVQGDVAFARIAGQDVVLVSYGRSGSRGMVQMLLRDAAADRLAAIGLETGESIWDVQLADTTSWAGGVLAAGDRYAYAASDTGLTVVRLDDGSVVARGAGIAGLGAAYVADYRAYGFDAGRAAVVALDAGGRLHTIRLDTARAEPADAVTAAAWRGRLSADGGGSFVSGAVATTASVPGQGTVRLVSSGDASGARLAQAGGVPAPAGPVFHDAGIVLDQAALLGFRGTVEPKLDTAVAAGRGYVVVQHAKGVNDDTVVLSVVSPGTGEVTASTELGDDAGRGVSAPGGRAVVLAPDDRVDPSDLVIVAADGGLRRVRVGETDFFGSPL